MNNVDSQPIYLFITWSVAQFTRNFGYLLFVNEFILLILVYAAAFRLKKHFQIPVWLCALLYLLLFYQMSFNLARQSLALAVCLCSFTCFLEKKYWKSIIIAFFALGFHSTALFYLSIFPIYYCITSKWGIKHSLMMKLIIFSLFALTVVFYDKVLMYLVLKGVVVERFENYSSDGMWGANFGIAPTFLSGVSVLFIYYFKKNLKTMNNTIDFFSTISVGAVILCFSSLITVYAYRIMLYFVFLSVAILPYCLTLINKQKQKAKIILAMVAVAIFYWYMNYIWNNAGNTYPYIMSNNYIFLR